MFNYVEKNPLMFCRGSLKQVFESCSRGSDLWLHVCIQEIQIILFSYNVTTHKKNACKDRNVLFDIYAGLHALWYPVG